ncbi:MAG: acyl-protein synthetase, partial [Coriobacteriia bacterium]|nr:acyl-protein synthetase [Coriobacteriia bacterium]
MSSRDDQQAWKEQLTGAILDVIAAGPEGDTAVFDELAPEVFAYQYANNEPYSRYCDALEKTPGSVSSWTDIPAYPTDAFKREIVASFPTNDAVQTTMTSGTTSPNQRGRIFRDEQGQELIFAANRAMTGTYLFPDFEAGQRCRMLLMTPGPDIAPTMGMAIGMDQARQHFGTPDSMFLVKRSGVDVRSLVAALRLAEETGVPIAMIGATSAYVYFFKACRDKGMRFRLPDGSRVCDGGGYRGRFGVVTRDDYYSLVEEILGV